ncbi:amidohydrolase family protein [Aquabacter sp. CN5-332]|uniref:amidohydrolase family protein n=1 Tax=Aquabacter sp. CN5-332 TaxID=3156608 RepID=UPI0032B5B425
MTSLSFSMPAGACDCHMHVFGPEADFPLSPKRSYTPPPATLEDYLARAAALGLARVVFVQPSPYGVDNSCLLDALRRMGGAGRGIVAIDASTQDADLAAMDAAGVRGVRVTLNAKGSDSAEAISGAIAGLVPRLAPLGWQIQIFASLASIAGAAESIRTAGVPLVFDHMALTKPGHLDSPAFQTLKELLSTGACWVKLSGADRVTGSDTDFAPAVPVMRALVAANPERVVWGSDWPHTGRHAGGAGGEMPLNPHRPLDDGALLSLLGEALGDAQLLRRVLVDNPARLYGFPPA